MWIPHHCYNGLIFKLLALELFCCWDIEQHFWWPISSIPKPSVLIYSHRRKSESEDFGLQINTRQIPPTCDNMQKWMKISWFGAGGDESIGKKPNWRTLAFYIKGNNIREYPMTSEEKISCYLDISWRPVCGTDTQVYCPSIRSLDLE